MNPDKKSTFEKDYADFRSAVALQDDSADAIRLNSPKIMAAALDLIENYDLSETLSRSSSIIIHARKTARTTKDKNINIPGADSIAIDNMPLEGQIVLDVYRDKLVDIGVEFEKQNRFINVIGAKLLTGRDPKADKVDDLMGFSNAVTTQGAPFYSVLLANLYLIRKKISADKILIHELGHCFGLKHGDYHSSNCFMLQGVVNYPKLCDGCMKEIRNSLLFADK